jgi:hypothetical protein
MASIYIASPYTIGDKLSNVHRQMDVYYILQEAGCYPYMPLLNHFLDERHPQTELEWLKQDKYWLAKSDYVLRLSGESKGADMEVSWAREMDIPVYFDIVELMKHLYNGVKKSTLGCPKRFI